MTIGTRTRTLRTNLGLTQQELADELAVSAQFVSQLELGTASPSVEVAARLAARLGTSIDYLVTGADRPPGDSTSAIRADKTLSPKAKRALITIIDELRSSP